MKNRYINVGSVVFIGSLFFANQVYARDLVSASNTAAETIRNVAQVLAVTGVVGGGSIMQLPGAGDFGKRVMVSGIVGCLCAFGAPAFVSLMRSVFGAM